MSRYLSAAETAKLVRKTLKRAFPETTFSVRSSRGSAINVGWIDGPLASDVDDVVRPFKGGGFDGMIDMAYSSCSWLMPDGSAFFASTTGTEGSAGTVPASEAAKPHPDAELVSFGSNFVFTDRETSPGTFWDAAKTVAEFWGFDPTTFPVRVTTRDWGAKAFRVPLACSFETDFYVESADEWATALVRKELARPEMEERLALKSEWAALPTPDDMLDAKLERLGLPSRTA